MSTTRQNISEESARKKEREALHGQIASMGLNEKLKFLKEHFKCTSSRGGAEEKREMIEGTKSFLGREKIANSCQFQPKTTVDLKHIIGYCCNSHYSMCPLYQFYACSSALMTHIRR